MLTDTTLFHNVAEALFEVPEGSAPTRLAHGLTAQNEDVHRRSRRLMQPAFRKAALDAHSVAMADETERFLAGIVPGTEVDVRRAMAELTSAIVLRCLFGVDGSGSGRHLAHLATRYLEGLISVGAIVLPFDLPGTPYRRFLRNSAELEALLRPLIDRRRGGGSETNDVLSLLIRARDEDGSSFDDDDLMGQSTLMYIAGHETTAWTLAWTLLLLAQHPRTHRATSDEVDAVLGGRPPTAGDAASMVMLDRVIKESQRLLPVTPFLIIRRATADFTLGEHQFGAGASIILSPLITHRLAEVFDDPLRFQPQRWERQTTNPYQYLPFGTGPRMCIGAAFASQVLRIVLPMLLQRFRFQLRDGSTVSTKVRGITLGPAGPLPSMVLPKGAEARPAFGVRGNISRLVQLS